MSFKWFVEQDIFGTISQTYCGLSVLAYARYVIEGVLRGNWIPKYPVTVSVLEQQNNVMRRNGEGRF